MAPRCRSMKVHSDLSILEMRSVDDHSFLGCSWLEAGVVSGMGSHRKAVPDEYSVAARPPMLEANSPRRGIEAGKMKRA